MRSRAALAGCAIALALLAGCSAPAEPEATVTSPVAPVPSTATGAAESTAAATAAATASHTAGGPPTASVSPTGASIPVPPPPADMARDDEAGAIAAAVYFMTELYPYLLNTQDSEPWLAMSEESCSFCSSIAEYVAAMRDSGETAVVEPISAGPSTSERMEAGTYIVRFEFRTSSEDHFGPTGSLVSHESEKTALSAFEVARVGDRWVIHGGNAEVQTVTP